MFEQRILYYWYKYRALPIGDAGFLLLDRKESRISENYIIGPGHTINWQKELDVPKSDSLLLSSNGFKEWEKIMLNQLDQFGKTDILSIGILKNDNGHFSFSSYDSNFEKLFATAQFPKKIYNKTAPKPITKPYLEPVPEKKRTFAWLLPLLIMVALLISVFSFYNHERSNNNNTLNPITQNDLKDSLDQVLTIQDTVLLEGVKEPIDLQNYCYIITGSFKKVKYMDSMKNQLKDEFPNYDVITNIYGQFTRVGLKIPCEDEILLNSIKDKITKDAWDLTLAEYY